MGMGVGVGEGMGVGVGMGPVVGMGLVVGMGMGVAMAVGRVWRSNHVSLWARAPVRSCAGGRAWKRVRIEDKDPG